MTAETGKTTPEPQDTANRRAASGGSGRPISVRRLRKELGIQSARKVRKDSRSASTAHPTLEPGGGELERLVGELQSELRRERAEILEPLLHRFSELGESLRAGQSVPPEVMDAGLALLDRYVRQLYDVHIRQFAEAGLDRQHEELCFLPMAQIEGEPERAERRIATVRALLSSYRAGLHGSDHLLGLELRNESIAELSWEGYSEDYAKTCIPSHLSPEAVEDWKKAMEAAEREFVSLRAAVQAFLTSSREWLLSSPPEAAPHE